MSASQFQVEPGKWVIPWRGIEGMPGILIQIVPKGGIEISDTKGSKGCVLPWNRGGDLKSVLVSAARDLGLEIKPGRCVDPAGGWKAKRQGEFYTWEIQDRGGFRAVNLGDGTLAALASNGDPWGIAHIHVRELQEAAAALCKAAWYGEHQEFSVPGFSGVTFAILVPPTDHAFIISRRASERATLSTPNIATLYTVLEEAEGLNLQHAKSTGVPGRTEAK